jgi:Pyruvate/2-oxoacid:ferredoxin oxidoreductase gamma subunit
VLVMMGSGAGAAEEAIERLNESGERVGMVKVRLYRPFDGEALVAALPRTVTRLAVLDRTKEPGAVGEPLYQDVVAALAEHTSTPPLVIGGRYGLSSKEFTPAMVAAVLAELGRDRPRRHFTVGIRDDVTNLSLEYDSSFSTEPADVVRAVFYGLGSDGTVGANHNSVKIIGEHTANHAQGYFVFDSKKSGSLTISHLRFGPRPIRSSYLIQRASFVACHQFGFLERVDVLGRAAGGGTFLLNSPFGPEEVWSRIPVEVQTQIIDKRLRFYVIDASRVARDAGLPGRVNTVLQSCYFALAGVLPQDQAIAAIKAAIKRTYAKRGAAVLDRNYAAVDLALAELHEVTVPARTNGTLHVRPVVPPEAPPFVQHVTAEMLAGRGDFLPVSALPVDGAFGLWAAVSPSLAHLVVGAARADSWATDAHKWLNVPYDCGLVFCAHPEAHRAAIGVHAEYLVHGDEGTVRDQVDWTPEFSRRARGFTVYAALRSLGRRGVVELVERTCAHARRFADELVELPGFELLNDVVLNQVLFRFESDDRTDDVLRRVQESGEAWLSGTVWAGRRAIRISVSYWQTSDEDVERTIGAFSAAVHARRTPAR